MPLCDPDSQAMRYARVVIIIVIFCYSLATMILCITAYTNLSENITVIINTIDNWKTGTINDIQITNNGACPVGYEYGYSYWWPGTSSGCDCRYADNSNFTKLGFSYGSCNSTELAHGCKTSPAYGEVRLTNWGNISSVTKTICVQRTNETFAAKGPKQGFTCPSGQKLCGLTPDNYFCTAQAQCPVTSVKVLNSNCGVTCIQLDTNKYLNISRGEDMLPLAEFRVNEYGMCNEANDRANTPGRSYYKLIASTGYNCGGEGNALWNVVDSQTEDKLFNANGLTSKINSLLSFGYYSSGTSGASFTYNLYDRGYVPFRFQCRSNMDDIINKSTDFSNIKSAHLALLIVSIFSFLVLGIFIPVVEALNLCGKDVPCFDGTGSSERSRILTCKKILYYSFKFLMLPFQIWAIVSLSKTKDLIKYVAGDDCSSDYMNQLIQKTSDSLQVSFKNDLTAIGMLAGLTFISLASFCFKQQKDDEERSISRRKIMDESSISNTHRSDMDNLAKGQPFQQQSFQQQPFQQNSQQIPFQQQQPYNQQPQQVGYMQNQQMPGGYQQQTPGYIPQQMQPQQQQQPQFITIRIEQPATQGQQNH